MADSNSQSQSSSVKNICDNALNSDSFFSEIAQSSASVRHSITQNQFAFRATDSFFSFPTQSTLPNLPSPSPFQTTFANTPCSHTDASPAHDSTMHLSLPTPNPWATVDLSPFHSTSLSISPQAPFSMRLSASMPDMLLPLPVPTPPSTGIQFSSSVPDSLPSSVQSNPSRSTERSGSSRSVHSLDGESHESSRSDSGAESGKKRTQIQRACVHCRRHKTRCDEQRPCGRCSRLGRASTCVDFVPTSSRFCQPKKKKTAKNDSPKSLNLNLAELKPFMGSTSSSPSYSPSPAVSPPISSSLPSPPSHSPLLASSLSQGLSDSAHSTPRLSLPQSLAVPSLLSSVPQGPSMAPSARLPWFDLLGPTILELDRRAKAAESPLPLDIATAMAWMTGYVKRRLLLNRPLDLASNTVSPVRTSNPADLPPITSSVAAVDLLKSDLSSAFALGTFASSTSLSAPVTSSVTAPSASFSLLCSLSSGAIGSSSAAAGSQSIPARSAGDSPLSAYDGLKAQHWMSTKECGMLAIVNNWRLTYDQIDPILQSTQQTSSVEQLRSRFDKEKAQTQRLPFGVVIYPLNLSGSLPGRANAYMAGLLGYDQTHLSSLLSLDPSRVFTAASLDRIDARICRMLLDGESFSTFAVTALTSDGREVQMIQSVSIKGIDGMPLYSVSFFQLRPSAGGMAVGNTILSE